MQRRPFTPASKATMHNAATILLVSDGSDGVEVFMMKRPATADFGGMYVFPGGKVDALDDHEAMAGHCRGRTDAQTSVQLEMASGGLAYWVAAVRECFEECGVLLAYDADGEPFELADEAHKQRFNAYREALLSGHQAFFDLCHQEGVSLAVDRILYFSHWITPEGPPRRYDTRFFITSAPENQEDHDHRETEESVWTRPEEALARHERGELNMIFPTLTTLKSICGYASVDALLAAVGRGEHLPEYIPDRGRQGMQPVNRANTG